MKVIYIVAGIFVAIVILGLFFVVIEHIQRELNKQRNLQKHLDEMYDACRHSIDKGLCPNDCEHCIYNTDYYL